MPNLDVRVLDAKEVWSKGDLTIHEVTLDVGGKTTRAKTYSKVIATPGWEGTVETYEKQGRNGAETFLKQPQKENNYQGGYQKKESGAAPKKEFDNFTMYLSYAKDLVVALQQTSGYDQAEFEKLLQATIKGGKVLYSHRPGAEPIAPAPVEKPSDDMPEGFLLDDVVPVDDVSMEDLNKLFPIGD